MSEFVPLYRRAAEAAQRLEEELTVLRGTYHDLMGLDILVEVYARDSWWLWSEQTGPVPVADPMAMTLENAMFLIKHLVRLDGADREVRSISIIPSQQTAPEVWASIKAREDQDLKLKRATINAGVHVVRSLEGRPRLEPLHEIAMEILRGNACRAVLLRAEGQPFTHLLENGYTTEQLVTLDRVRRQLLGIPE